MNAPEDDDFHTDELEEMAREFHASMNKKRDIVILWRKPYMTDPEFDLACDIEEYSRAPRNSKLN